ncbi:hypothetical protein CYY_001780 [Polysphondylium violaceum]|uniref:Peptidase M28 domain-containing protein n=1 Tax=Polysphondylium violaceum TaxID=133409 RepID=A0A8J4Q1E0_9MYCE|nr:hypothetical protein CYY_001780 [Polysphondylium violaceum]
MPTAIAIKTVRVTTLKASLFKKYTESHIDRIDNHLSHVLKERVVDTKQHKQVQDYIVSQFDQEDWNVELNQFKDTTPHGMKTFTNIIVTSKSDNHDPHSQAMIIAAHYDSKYIKNIKFLGAIDSAVSVSMIIDLAHSLKDLTKESERKLIIIFFDGEEAFENWTPTDSIYGARHLASKLLKTELQHNDVGKPFYDTIDFFLLLDLIGASQPKFYMFSQKTEGLFKKLTEIEDKLAQRRLISVKPYKYFNNILQPHSIEDDHTPFLPHVPILHLIPVPFPSCWHTAKDNADVLDKTVIEDLSKIFRIFVASYLTSSNDI